MNTRLPTTLISLLTLAALAVAPACKKEPTVQPDEAATGDGDVEPEEAPPELEPLPPQDPDPAAISALYQRYLQGEYEAVASSAAELRDTMTADTQVRAHAMAGALMALAAAEAVPEDAKAAAQQAVADGERLGDVEVQQLAAIAQATYQVRVHEAAAGQAALEAALALGGPYKSLNNLMLAEAHLNQAFGEGEEDTQIKHPERLDQAKAAYEAAIDGTAPLLDGAAHEGLAAVAKYQRDKDGVCLHAQQAEDLYAANGANDYIREVPSLLAADSRCKDFKKAAGPE
ncbi:hypothetical protein DB30_06559 [Enhygromyxa salina]|uniref:Lipoprotein n=1 Tax=Enhygromyxa salina TaxID=215803 RepID=A0A0C2A6E4_9BACT|nr:hypothetical protein [Enhygromyxa salina]KIG18948.1 hypothetical protein DB30_06559 [Enhygromyxa salina]